MSRYPASATTQDPEFGMQDDVPVPSGVHVMSSGQDSGLLVQSCAQNVPPFGASVQRRVPVHAPASAAQSWHRTTVEAFPTQIALEHT